MNQIIIMKIKKRDFMKMIFRKKLFFILLKLRIFNFKIAELN